LKYLNNVTPSFVLGGYNFSSLNIGDAHTCGVLYNGRALCWGGNWQGQLGIGLNNRTFMYAPTFVSGDYNFSSLFLGDVHSCGTLHNGSALCWGYNDYGQLGDGTITRKTIPVFTYGNYQFSEMDLGWFHTCGLLYNGSALCWGENARGYLGIGNTTDMRAPTFVSGDYNFSSLSNGGSIFVEYYKRKFILLGASIMKRIGIFRK
jgi:alpha-tubulin suppressor-like RCC1 family protein